jgi:hypothetical protein
MLSSVPAQQTCILANRFYARQLNHYYPRRLLLRLPLLFVLVLHHSTEGEQLYSTARRQDCATSGDIAVPEPAISDSANQWQPVPPYPLFVYSAYYDDRPAVQWTRHGSPVVRQSWRRPGRAFAGRGSRSGGNTTQALVRVLGAGLKRTFPTKNMSALYCFFEFAAVVPCASAMAFECPTVHAPAKRGRYEPLVARASEDDMLEYWVVCPVSRTLWRAHGMRAPTHVAVGSEACRRPAFRLHVLSNPQPVAAPQGLALCLPFIYDDQNMW